MVGNATVSVTGAAGVASEWNNAGKGDEVSGDLTLTYNEPFLVCVDFGGGLGGASATDNPLFPTPDGGGASSIATNTLLLVGGGGGGATIDGLHSGGSAGDPNGSPTDEGNCIGGSACGLGGTESAVGQGGASFTPQGGVATKAGSPGSAHSATQPGSGGNGGNAVDGESNTTGGAGGGAGYYGGGGGTGGEEPDGLGNVPAGIGGGGSDYCASTVSNCSVTSGAGTQHDVNTGAGEPEVVITMNQTPTSLSISAPTSQTYGTTIASTSIAASLSSGNSPTGSINFYYVVQSSATAPSSCTGATLGSSVSVSGNGTYNPTTSYNVSQPGFVFWYATYSGDGANSGSTTSCGTPDTQIQPANQSISYTSPSTSLVVGNTYSPNPMGGASGNTVQITIDNSTTGDCSLTGSTVYLNHVGSCQVDFSQPGSIGEYNATSTNVTFDIAQASQSLSISPPTDPTVGANYTPVLTGGGSNEPVVVTVDATTTNDACSTDGTIVSFLHAGKCVLDANELGNSDYLAGTTSINFGVAQASQSLSISPPTDPKVGANYTPVLTGGGSNEPVMLTVDSATSNNACSINGTAVDFLHDGLCVLDANELGNSDYLAGTTSINFGVAQASQSLSISPPTDPTVGANYTPVLTGGGSNEPVVVTVDATTTNDACSTDGTIVLFLHAGKCVLDANELGNSDYLAGTTSINFGVAQASQSLSISPPTDPKVGANYTPVLTGGGSNEPVMLTVDATTTNDACSTDGTIVSFLHAGKCVLDANELGNSDYLAGTTSINFGVAQAPVILIGGSVLGFTSTPPSPSFVGGTYTPIAAGGAPGVAIAFSIDVSTTNDACSLSGSVVTFDHAGTCVLDATQATSAATTVSQSFSVEPGVAPALVISTLTVLHLSTLHVAHDSTSVVHLEVVVRTTRGQLVAHGVVTILGVGRVKVVDGRATLKVTAGGLARGTHSLYAAFGGFGSFAKSRSRVVKLVVT